MLSAANRMRARRGARRCAAAGAFISGAILLTAASAAPSPLEVLRSGASDRGFERAESVRAFAFPQDHGPHPSFRHEWWYFTGHLQARDGERFGFEVTFFRVALAPAGAETRESAEASTAGESTVGESVAGESVSQWRARQIYVAHFAVTDIGRRKFDSTQRVARDALGLSGAQSSPFRVWLGGWSVAAQDDGNWRLRAGDCAYRLDLRLHPLLPPVLNGDRGLSVKSDEPGNASYYYSIPRIAVEGEIVRGVCPGRSAEAVGEQASGEQAIGEQGGGAARSLDVHGNAWLDREWGSGSLGAHQAGWDWFALQLADGSALMFYALRDEHGAPDRHSAGTWVDRSGRAHALVSRDVHIEVVDHWTSPDGARYPSRWRLSVPSLGLDVSAVPVLADQELETTPRYWEGDVDVGGTLNGKPISGEGYVELVGYAGR